MTLDKVIVRLTKAAVAPGVAFVALSRVRHPDHLMLEDTFPDMATIMRQSEKESFRARQRWERAMRVRFSRTLRRYMRDPQLYSSESVWTNEDSDVADLLIHACAAQPDVDDATLLQSVHDADPEVSLSGSNASGKDYKAFRTSSKSPPHDVF